MENRDQKILIVDDSEDNLIILKALIEEGFPEVQVLFAREGAEAVRIAEEQLPSLILLDVIMPDIDGYLTCELIKSKPATEDIPVVFVTALKGEKEERIKALEVGAEGFLSKPVDYYELTAQIRAMFKIKEGNLIKKIQKSELETQVNSQTEELKKIHLATLNLLQDLQTENEARRLAEAELRKNNEKLTSVNKEKDRLFSIVAHDLKSPINGFLALTKMMTDDIETLSLNEITKIALSLNQSATNIFKLLENLLQWSRLQLGGIVYNPREIMIYPFMEDCLQFFTDPIEMKKLKVHNNIPDGKEVWADGAMLQTIFRNIISNAIKFSPLQSNININLEHDETGNYLLSISDEGKGIEQKILPLLFSLDENKLRPGTDGETGTGLGLIICKEFAEKNKGSLKVISVEGKGTQVSLSLPAFH